MSEFKRMTPFVKWAGGKGQLLEKLGDRVPNTYNKYYEPFIGGGALLLNQRPNIARVNDINMQLINTYLQLKNDARGVIRKIQSLDQQPCDKDFYLQVREQYNQKISNGELDVECAALFIWINKHCFNGLYRVNSKGLFNVPYNNKTNGVSMNEANLMSIGYYLTHNDVQITCLDFEEVCEDVVSGDFVYFDSPYVPISETSSFVDYTKDGFTYEDHKRLSLLFRELDKRGAKVMLSNHNVPLVHELYDGFLIEEVDVRRSINSNAQKRDGKEVIIRNYE